MSTISGEHAYIRNKWAEHLAHEQVLETAKKTAAQASPAQAKLIENCFDEHWNLVKPVPTEFWASLGEDLGSAVSPAGELKFGIIGSGAAGLFMGMILDYLSEKLEHEYGKHAAKISYEILEANGDERVGGRLYTHKFNPHSEHDHLYYDVGAMRFPDNPVMKRLFDLFDYLGMKKKEAEDVKNATKGDLIPYYFNSGDGNSEPWHFNGKTVWGGTYAEVAAKSPGTYDTFNVNKGVDKKDQIPMEILQHSPDDVFADTVKPYAAKLKHDIEKGGKEGWEYLLKMDEYSTRQFLTTAPKDMVQKPPPSSTIRPLPYNFNTIEWLETLNGGTGWYDQAFSETVLESLDFGYDKSTKWYCILGGAQELAKRMEKRVKDKCKGRISYNSPVTALDSHPSDAMSKVNVHWGSNGKPQRKKEYDAVFSSAPLGSLRKIDTTGLYLDYGTKQAMRSLTYGASAKIGIKFKHPWWRKDKGKMNSTKGGLGRSDLNIRTCVYPSYNLEDKLDQPATLLCSYTWQQDAERIASLFSNGTQDNEKNKALKDLLTRELARLHTENQANEDQLRCIIDDSWEEFHAWDWGHDPYSAGAFAFFGPQQFRSMWNKIIMPKRNFSIIGEAASPHHAWVVGALESAVQALSVWLGQRIGLLKKSQDTRLHEQLIYLQKILTDQDGTGRRQGIPFVGLPAYMGENHASFYSLAGAISFENVL